MTAKLITSFVDRREAQLALDYARCHDWGVEARLAKDNHGDFWVTNITDTFSIMGLVACERTCVPATLDDVKAFGRGDA